MKAGFSRHVCAAERPSDRKKRAMSQAPILMNPIQNCMPILRANRGVEVALGLD